MLLLCFSGVLQAQRLPFPVEEASIAGLEAAYLAGRTTVREVVQAHLDRIAAYDKRGPLINSLITINPYALEEADRLDAAMKASSKAVGPLHGIPVIVKDNIDVAGLPMTAGVQGWKNYRSPEDAPLIKKIRSAGGIILAKASLSEFTPCSPDLRAIRTTLRSRMRHLPAYALLWDSYRGPVLFRSTWCGTRRVR